LFPNKAADDILDEIYILREAGSCLKMRGIKNKKILIKEVFHTSIFLTILG